jgi:hypothetical protein
MVQSGKPLAGKGPDKMTPPLLPERDRLRPVFVPSPPPHKGEGAAAEEALRTNEPLVPKSQHTQTQAIASAPAPAPRQGHDARARARCGAPNPGSFRGRAQGAGEGARRR